MFNIFIFLVFVLSLLGQFLGLYNLGSEYNLFADARRLCGIDYCFDTISNFGFLVTGIYLYCDSLRKKQLDLNKIFLILGSFLIFLGSSYYHLNPDDFRLLFDRLPIACVFSIVLLISLEKNNYIEKNERNSVLFILFGLFSVLLWYFTASSFNLIFLYVFLQYGGFLILTYILLDGKNKNFNKRIILVLILYVFAKVFEKYDLEFFELTNFLVSGHTIKHIFSSLALFCFVNKLEKF